MGMLELLKVLLVITAATLAKGQLIGSIAPETVLQNQPSFSTFRRLLTDTGVASEINQRTSLTLLLPQNALLDAAISRSGSLPLPILADILRYHCLLQYLDIPLLRSISSPQGTLVTTLYQTTGRAAGQNGFLNITSDSDKIHLGLPFAADGTFNASIKQNITQFPYNISYMEIDSVLIPPDLGRPQPAAAASILNLTTSLQRSGRFNTWLGLMQTTGLTALLATLPSYSLFVPTDDAFQALPKGAMDALSPSQASKLLQYHTLPEYAGFDSLSRRSGVTVRTLASSGDDRRFLLQVNGSAPVNESPASVNLGTGVNSAQVLSAVYDQSPAAAYSVNRVLLPPEIFVTAAAADASSSPASAPGLVPAPAPGLEPVLSPAAAVQPPVLPDASPPVATPPPVESDQSQAKSPVVDVGNLPPASGPGAAASTDAGANSASGATVISSLSTFLVGLVALL